MGDGDGTRPVVRDGRVEIHYTPTKERLAQGDVVLEEGTRGGAQFRSYQFPLDFYLRRSLLTDRQHRAGEKLHRLWYYGCAASGYVLMRYAEPTPAPTDPTRSATIPAEYREAMDAIRGGPERRVAYAVCCLGETISHRWRVLQATHAVALPSRRTVERADMPRLVSALDDLVSHFGY